MNITVTALTLIVLLGASTLGEEPEPPARPPGVREAQWVPISDVLGIIITQDAIPLVVRDAKTGVERKEKWKNPPPVRGTFAIRRNGTWYRLEVEPNAATVFNLAPR